MFLKFWVVPTCLLLGACGGSDRGNTDANPESPAAITDGSSSDVRAPLLSVIEDYDFIDQGFAPFIEGGFTKSFEESHPLYPAVADVNNDNYYDIVLGSFFNFFELYPQSVFVAENTKSEPFIGFDYPKEYVTSDYAQEYWWSSSFYQARYSGKIALSDINSDGKLELFATEYDDGFIAVFENIGTSGSYRWKILSGYYLDPSSSLYLTDIDADGDNDLFAGVDSGIIYFIENQCTAYSPCWASPQPYNNGLLYGYSVIPVFHDFDRDGDFDLFVENDAGVIIVFENSGTAQAAEWGEVPFAVNDGDSFGRGSHFDLYDFDSDGDGDLVLGTAEGKIKYYKNDMSWSLGVPSLVPPVIDVSTTTVNLMLTASDDQGVYAYYLSESPDRPHASSSGWEQINGSPRLVDQKIVSFVLSGSAGKKSIFAWFKDEVGNVSERASTLVNYSP